MKVNNEKIRELRKKRKLTQEALGEKCVPKLQASAVRRYELGLQNPKLSTLSRIADALEVPVSELLVEALPKKPVFIKVPRLNDEEKRLVFSKMAHSDSMKILADMVQEIEESAGKRLLMDFNDFNFTEETHEILKDIKNNYYLLNEKGHAEADKHLRYACAQIKLLAKIPEYTEEKEV